MNHLIPARKGTEQKNHQSQAEVWMNNKKTKKEQLCWLREGNGSVTQKTPSSQYKKYHKRRICNIIEPQNKCNFPG